MMKVLVAAAFVTLLLAAPSRGQSYEEKAARWNQLLDEIIAVHQLDTELSRNVKWAVATWYFRGLCDGSGHLKVDTMQAIMGIPPHRPDYPSAAATLQMIGALEREHFGQPPEADLCQYLLGIANAYY